MKSRSVPRKGISGATETVNGGLLQIQAILWDVYEDIVSVLFVPYQKIKTFARGRGAHLQQFFFTFFRVEKHCLLFFQMEKGTKCH